MLSSTERQIVRYVPFGWHDKWFVDPNWADLCSLWKGRCAVTNGCFDVLHEGHLSIFKYMDDFCYAQKLFPLVLMNSDSSVRKIKGPLRPVVPDETRASLVTSLRWAMSVILFDDETPKDLMDVLEPRWVIKGGDYLPEDVVISAGAQVKILPYVPGKSTTNILKGRL